MRLVTYWYENEQRIGAVHGAALIDLSSFAPDMLTLISSGPEMLAQSREKVAAAIALASLPGARSSIGASALIPLDSIPLRAPIPRPSKNIMCLGQNYVAHAMETAQALGRGGGIPEHPVFFTKAVTAINHPNGIIPYQASITSQLDWEGELAFIIGKTGKNIPPDEAMQYVFGYTIMNDVTARDMQRQHRQFFKGKSLDGCAPLGPWIVTADEIPDPHNLNIVVHVNDTIVQQSNTSEMIFKIPEIIAVLSRGMTLEAGDIIATGTPSGVGMAMDPPRFLQPGDTITIEIEHIGALKNTVANNADVTKSVYTATVNEPGNVPEREPELEKD